MAPRSDASLIQIGPDPPFESTPVRSFRSDVTITSTAAAGLAAVAAGLEAAGAGGAERTQSRRAELVGELAPRREREVASWARAGRPAHVARVQEPRPERDHQHEIIGSNATVVNELRLTPAVMSFTGPHGFSGSTTSASLGWGGGTALGTKLADSGRLVA